MGEETNPRIHRRSVLKSIQLGIAGGGAAALFSTNGQALSDESLLSELEVDPGRPTPPGYQLRLKLKARRSMFQNMRESASQNGGA
ncbi:hypothetical protein [Halobaculum sp. EA56]|uniref:hypothetical protein n=1 Tax=Halobaculum sp. EA56 TaxID=3421648 RepID=UPI003EB6FB48